MKTIDVPQGLEKYKETDMKLLTGEKVESILGMSPISKLRNYVLCSLIAFLGFQLWSIFSQTSVSVELLFPALITLIVTYFMWTYKVTESGKNLIFSIFKYLFYISLLSYLITFMGSILGPIITTFNPNFTGPSINPADNINNILSSITYEINENLIQYSQYGELAGLGLIAASLLILPFIYMSTRGRLYYVSNKRIIVREKSGTVQVTTLPLDKIVEVTAFQGFFGRLLGYGDVILTMTSGEGTSETLRPKPVSPLGDFYRVKRRLEGIKDIWNIKDLILTLRERYVQANYLQNMENELKRIREAVEEKPLKPLQYVK
jgi:hypothetical protein